MQLKRADLIQAAHEEGYMWNELNLQYLTQMQHWRFSYLLNVSLRGTEKNIPQLPNLI